MTAERLFEILGKYAQSQGIQLNKDKEYVMEILNGLLTNESRYGYRSCPCRLAAGVKEKDADIICPCVYQMLAIARVCMRFGEVGRATLHPDGTPESDTTHTVVLALLVAELAREQGLDVARAVDSGRREHGARAFRR